MNVREVNDYIDWLHHESAAARRRIRSRVAAARKQASTWQPSGNIPPRKRHRRGPSLVQRQDPLLVWR